MSSTQMVGQMSSLQEQYPMKLIDPIRLIHGVLQQKLRAQGCVTFHTNTVLSHSLYPLKEG